MQRQYSGTAGRTQNCQIGIFAAYATTLGHALVDRELLPKSWTDDIERCRAAKIPNERAFATKNDLARTMVLRALASPLPVAWVAADAAYGQDSRFRRFLEDAGLSYVMAVPKSQQVHGPLIDHLIGQAPPEAWQRLSLRRRRQGATNLRLGRRPASGCLGIRRRRAHPPAMDACPPQHHQAGRARLFPGCGTPASHPRRPRADRRLPLEDRGLTSLGSPIRWRCCTPAIGWIN